MPVHCCSPCRTTTTDRPAPSSRAGSARTCAPGCHSGRGDGSPSARGGWGEVRTPPSAAPKDTTLGFLRHPNLRASAVRWVVRASRCQDSLHPTRTSAEVATEGPAHTELAGRPLEGIRKFAVVGEAKNPCAAAVQGQQGRAVYSEGADPTRKVSGNFTVRWFGSRCWSRSRPLLAIQRTTPTGIRFFLHSPGGAAPVEDRSHPKRNQVSENLTPAS